MSIHHFSNEQFPEIFLACKIFKVITKGFIGIHWTRLGEILKQSKVQSCLVLQDIIHFNKSLQYIRYAINVMAEFLVIHIATRICPLNEKLCSLQRIRYLALSINWSSLSPSRNAWSFTIYGIVSNESSSRHS